MTGGGSGTGPPATNTAANIGAHYDELDSFYRDVWGAHVHHGLWLHGKETLWEAQENLVRRIAEKAQLTARNRVCDIGCGYGETARWLARNERCDVVAITNSPAQYSFANTSNDHESNPRYALGDWLENDLLEASFDTAIAIESAEHFNDLGGFYKEARRVLRHHGRLVLSSWTAAESVKSAQHRLLLRSISRGTHMAELRTASSHLALAKAAGFTRESYDDVTAQVTRTWPALACSFARKVMGSPHYLRFLFGRHASNRRFALAMVRIWTAFRLGALRYAIFTYAAD